MKSRNKNKLIRQFSKVSMSTWSQWKINCRSFIRVLTNLRSPHWNRLSITLPSRCCSSSTPQIIQLTLNVPTSPLNTTWSTSQQQKSSKTTSRKTLNGVPNFCNLRSKNQLKLKKMDNILRYITICQPCWTFLRTLLLWLELIRSTSLLRDYAVRLWP